MKLDLTLRERAAVRKAGLAVAAISRCRPPELSLSTGIPRSRCEKLVALAGFQLLGSVGPKAAEDLWALGCKSFQDLSKADPVELYDRLGRMAGQRMDPCVEDVLRCAIAQARFPGLSPEYRQWWAWQSHRGRHSVDLPKGAGARA